MCGWVIPPPKLSTKSKEEFIKERIKKKVGLLRMDMLSQTVSSRHCSRFLEKILSHKSIEIMLIEKFPFHFLVSIPPFHVLIAIPCSMNRWVWIKAIGF